MARFSRNPFALLAVELRQVVLCQLDDIDTLQSALESDASLKSAFQGSESVILDAIVRNRIPHKLLPEALAVLSSRKFDEKSRTIEAISNVIDTYIKRQVPRHIQWTIDDARLILDLHRVVRFFVDDFSSAALRLFHKDHPENPPPALSSTEHWRISGTFYRFELYCNLFRRYGHFSQNYPSGKQQKDLFLQNFSPWENVQLGSIFDYIIGKITPAYTDMAEHDIMWGEWNVPIDSRYGDAEFLMEYLSSAGLDFLRKLVSATTYEERHELIGEFPGPRYDFLSDALSRLTRTHEDGSPKPWDGPLSEYTEEVTQTLLGQNSTDDPDPGPFNAWYWTNKHFQYGHSIYSSYAADAVLRRRGYVMWDQSRLIEEWDFSWDAYYQIEHPPDDYITDDEFDARYKEITDSYDRRSQIWQEGGRGWWSKEDESKIVWPKQTIRQPEQRRPLTPIWRSADASMGGR